MSTTTATPEAESLAQAVEQLQDEVAQLKDENKSLGKQVDGLQNENDELYGRVDKLENKNETLENENDELHDRVDKLENKNETLENENDELHDRVDELEDENETLQNQVDDLETEIDDLQRLLESNLEGVHNRIGSVEDRVQTVEEAQSTAPNPGGNTSETGLDFETPLENIVAWGEHVAEHELSANKLRARFVAAGIDDLASSVGDADHRRFAISSREIRKVIKVKEDRDSLPRRETANRIIEFLDSLGKDDVAVRMNDGMKKVIFEPELVERLVDADGMTLTRAVVDSPSVTVSVMG